MIFVDHAAAGIILPSLVEPYQNCPAVTVSVISALLPDITILFGSRRNISYLSHRRATHNLLMMPILSILPVILVYLVFDLILGVKIENTYIQLYFLSLLSYGLHIAIDTVTPYGTKLFYPLSTKKVTIDLVTSLEPVTYIISITFIISFIYQRTTHGFPDAQFFLLFMTLYFLHGVFILTRKFLKSRKYRRYLKSRYPGAVYLDTIPRPFGRWKGIGENSLDYIVISDGKGEDECKLYTKKIEIPDQIKSSRHYKEFMEYARYPAVLARSDRYSMINLVYNPGSLRLDFIKDKDGTYIPQPLTGAKIPNKGI